MHDRVVDALELIVDRGRPANAWRFFQLGHDLLALLDELSDTPVAWQVLNLGSGSALASIAPPDGHPEEADVLRLAYSSLAEVQRGGQLSDDWTPDAVRVAHRFVGHGQLSEGETDWVAPRLRLVSESEATDGGVDLTPALGEQLAVLQPFERTMPGSVRGTLVGLNVSRGNRASLRLASHRITRVAFGTALRGDLKDALYQQVELSGTVKQDAEGRVFHIRADEVSLLSRPQARWVDLFGIDPGFTGDATADEHLETMRGTA